MTQSLSQSRWAFLTLTAGILLSQLSSAGILLEPFVGYDMGARKATTKPSNINDDGKTTGVSYGSRLGYRFMNGLALSAEYTGSSGKLKDDSGVQPIAADVDYVRTALGAVIGYNINMYRFWAGYGFSDQFTEKGTTVDTKLKGTNYKIGVGVIPAPHISINFEYVVPKYTAYAVGSGADTDVSSAYSKFDISVMTLSLSAPFDFGK